MSNPKGVVEHPTSPSFDGVHRVAVNRSASVVFWKSPWWAKVPLHDRALVETQLKALSADRLVDVTKAPPVGVIDRRGLKLIWNNGSSGVITGFAHVREKLQSRRPISNKKPAWWKGDNWDARRKNTCHIYVHYWWVLMNGVEYTTLRWQEPSRRGWRVA